uniref:Protein tyrosine phosphatase receptor type N n=1 Tax=Myripristis murdjan TaxID=586833 RepID=A0A667XEG7_9TELE
CADMWMWTFICMSFVCVKTSRCVCVFLSVFCLSCADGLFGQCQAPQQPPVQYQLSVPVLHKLQEVLRQLLMQGLTWQDDITQLVIGRELSQVPQIGPASKRHNKLDFVPRSSEARGPQGPEQPADPELMQQYLDYMVLDAPQSSIHMQRPLQKYGYQDEEERSLNSLDDNRAFPLLDSTARSGSRGNTLDRDRQLLQDLVSLYLSSSSSPPPPPPPPGAVAAAAGLPASSSSSSFFPELDFPLDYGEDYISQHAQVSEPQQEERAEKKAQKDYDSLGDLDERSLQKLAVLLEHYGLDMKDLTPEQMDNLPAALKQLQLDSSYFDKNTKDKYRNNAGTQKKIAEASMTYKIDKSPAAGGVSSGPAIAPDAPPSPAKSPKLGAPPAPLLKETPPTAPAKEEKQGKKEPAAVTKAEEYGYIVTNQSVVGPALTFRLRPNSLNLTAEDVASKAVEEKNFLESKTGLKILQSGVGERNDGKALPLATRVQPGSRWVFATLVAVACVGGILVAAMTIACLRHHAHRLAAEKLGLGPEGGAITHQEYQDLCRQHMASKGAFGRLEAAALGAVGGSGGGGGAVGGGGGGGGGTDTSRVSSVSSQFSDGAQASPSSHSSTPSWCEEPAQANMDISTGHMILAYMEDHLRNKDRLMKEWEALCSYQAEPSAVSVAQSEANAKKNRCPDSVPYDHSRVKLKAEINPSRADYINASTIIEHDPRMPAYIATQGPLSHTISDFWQMVWENGCTVIVMMTALVEDGEKQCDRYWPDEGSSLYHIYEVNLVSEHIWCNDFLVRSFYLKNVQTQETRTLTQFHFLSWPAQGIPTSTRPLLDFRRKVNKCYRGRSCPIICVFFRLAGVKEIDIAATLEHVRDQRPGMVRTKDQFEFALTAVAEEVNAILKALPQ